jgi:hypothetical protein
MGVDMVGLRHVGETFERADRLTLPTVGSVAIGPMIRADRVIVIQVNGRAERRQR